uniref:LAGLIDADG homing endonuclease n=1 Tax=Panagrolaimus davidi TaxID=227884 RepID=A0A914PXH3_9BILA
MTAAEKDCWNIYFNLNPLEYLNIAIGKLFKKSEFKLQLSGKFICNTGPNTTKKRIEEISHRIQNCSLTDLQIMN